MTEYTNRAGETWRWNGSQWARVVSYPAALWNVATGDLESTSVRDGRYEYCPSCHSPDYHRSPDERESLWTCGYCNARHTLYMTPDWKRPVSRDEELAERIDNLERHLASDRRFVAEAFGSLHDRITKLSHYAGVSEPSNDGAPSAELLERVRRVTAQIRSLNDQ